jgi:hypothetical protein
MLKTIDALPRGFQLGHLDWVTQHVQLPRSGQGFNAFQQCPHWLDLLTLQVVFTADVVVRVAVLGRAFWKAAAGPHSRYPLVIKHG